MGATGLPAPVSGRLAGRPGSLGPAWPYELAGSWPSTPERDPLAPGLPADAAREALRLPDRRLVAALAQAAESVTISGGLLPRRPGRRAAAGACQRRVGAHRRLA